MQHPNHQSSSTLETDDSGAVISYEEYHPFGTTSYQAMEKPVRAAAKRYRYTGMERDEETGLSYHNARYYISWLGRWLNPDPIGIGDGVNVYAYCHNNPVVLKDESGNGPGEIPHSSHKPPDLSLKNTVGQTNGVVPNGTAATTSGVTGQAAPPQKAIKNPQSQANNTSAPTAATGNGASSAGAAHYKKGTEQMQTAAALNKVFAANGIGSKPEEESNSGTKLGGLLQAGGGVAGMIGSLLLASTGVGFLLAAALFAYNLDTTVSGLQQAQTGLETQSIFDQKVGGGMQRMGFSESEAAFGTSVLNVGLGAFSGGGLLKTGSLASSAVEVDLTVANATENSSRIWQVGAYKDIRGLEVGLDAHHVGQKALMKKFIPDYNLSTAPAILVPEVGHTIRGANGIVSRSTSGLNSAREVLARDIFELRRVYGSQGIPNSSLQELIQMNKSMYPEAFIKN